MTSHGMNERESTIEDVRTENTMFPGGRTTSEVLRPWPELKNHVKRYIKRCACCLKMTCLKIPIATQKFTTPVLAPVGRINIDRIGPLPESAEGYNCIFGIIDCFTRWVSLYPMKGGFVESARSVLL
jgi:hypothetical protein